MSDLDTVETAVRNFVAGHPRDQDLEIVRLLSNPQQAGPWRTEVYNTFPSLRPEEHAALDDDNEYLVLLRFLLWTDDLLGTPKPGPMRARGFCTIFWQRVVRDWWRWQPLQCDETIRARVVRAFQAIADHLSKLDESWDPRTGASIAVADLALAEERRAGVSDEEDFEQRKIALIMTLQNVGIMVSSMEKYRTSMGTDSSAPEVVMLADALQEGFEAVRSQAMYAEGLYTPVAHSRVVEQEEDIMTEGHQSSDVAQMSYPVNILAWLSDMPWLRDRDLTHAIKTGRFPNPRPTFVKPTEVLDSYDGDSDSSDEEPSTYHVPPGAPEDWLRWAQVEKEKQLQFLQQIPMKKINQDRYNAVRNQISHILNPPVNSRQDKNENTSGDVDKISLQLLDEWFHGGFEAALDDIEEPSFDEDSETEPYEPISDDDQDDIETDTPTASYTQSHLEQRAAPRLEYGQGTIYAGVMCKQCKRSGARCDRVYPACGTCRGRWQCQYVSQRSIKDVFKDHEFQRFTPTHASEAGVALEDAWHVAVFVDTLRSLSPDDVSFPPADAIMSHPWLAANVYRRKGALFIRATSRMAQYYNKEGLLPPDWWEMFHTSDAPSSAPITSSRRGVDA